MLNKTAFITGVNRGIGKKIFTTFYDQGYSIICSTRSQNKSFEKFVSKLHPKKNQIIKILNFDLNDHSEIKKAIKNLQKEKPIIDVLINNAGMAQGSLFEMTSIDSLKEVFQVNFFSQLLVTQLLLRFLKKSEGASIINIGSISGLVGDQGTLSYGSSKSALMFSTKVLANELKRYNIRVNSIAPGITETEMKDQMDQRAAETMLARSYLARACSTSDVASLALFLSSPEASYINGQILRLDGGMVG